MRKLIPVFIAALLLVIMFSVLVFASMWNFFVFSPQGKEVEFSKPNLISASAYPEKVMLGQVLLVTALVEDVYGIKKAVAIFENEQHPS